MYGLESPEQYVISNLSSSLLSKNATLDTLFVAMGIYAITFSIFYCLSVSVSTPYISLGIAPTDTHMDLVPLFVFQRFFLCFRVNLIYSLNGNRAFFIQTHVDNPLKTKYTKTTVQPGR